MDQLYTTVVTILTIAWTVACFIFYHKIFTVYCFDIGREIVREIIVCLFFGFALAGLTLKFATPLAVGLIIVGWILTQNIDSTVLRRMCFAFFVIIAIVIFFTGKWIQKNINEKSGAKNSSSVMQYDDSHESESINVATIYTTEAMQETEPYIPVETEPNNYSTVETQSSVSPPPVADTPGVTEAPVSYSTGYVMESSGGLKIRSGPGTSYQEVGRLAPNEQVVISEQIYNESYMWGRIDRGWVCMDYIVIGTDPDYRDTYQVGYIIGAVEGVNVRSGPAVSYEQTGRVALGSQVIVTKLHNNGVSEWAYIGNGWICTDYIYFGEVPPGTDFYGNSDPADSSISAWDTGNSGFAGYDSYGRELYVGSYVCIGARQGSSEYAVGTINSLDSNGVPVVNFTEIYNNIYPEEIRYCMNDLADKIEYFGYYCGEVEAQYLQLYIWG